VLLVSCVALCFAVVCANPPVEAFAASVQSPDLQTMRMC
jgi:hypothetical protein